MSDPGTPSRSRLGGRFVLETELGSGGMATVYLGRDEVLDRPVAVKVLKHGFDHDIAARFQREGRTAARLSHPNVVQVFDAGEAELEGRAAPYIVMEHVPGGDLKGLIDSDGRLDSERVARLGSGISAGLAHAHERGIVHRDIKPHNILLDEFGAPKLTDFGIARALDTTAMTVSGVYLGTALYSSPEQLKGEEITPKSDVYSLGAALYQAVSGEPPFSGTALEVANQHAVRQPDSPGARRARGGPDSGLDALILACLAKDPADRPTAAEAHDRLSALSGGYGKAEPVVAGAGVRSAESGRGVAKRRKPLLRTFAGAAALVLILVAGAAFAMMGDGVLQSPATGVGDPGPGERAASPPESGSGGGQSSSGSSSRGSDESGGSGGSVPEVNASVNAGNSGSSGSSGSGSSGGGSSGEGSGVAATGAAAEADAAAQTVQDVYELAAAEDYEASYGLLSAGFRQREVGSLQVWAGTFDTLESISFVQGPTASVTGDTARVAGTTRAVHTDGTEFNRGTWTLVREGGEWRLADLSIQDI